MDPAAEVRSVLRQMREVIGDNPRFDSLSDRMETLVMENIVPTITNEFGFTPSELRLFTILHHHIGKVVSYDAIMDAMYWNRRNPPDQSIIKVFGFKVRKKLRGSRYVIRNTHGVGFRLVSSAPPE